MRVVILAPWRGGDVVRERSWALVKAYYETTGRPIYEGDSGSQPFSVAQSCNRASEAAGNWDIAVIINTDCVIPIPNLNMGIGSAIATGRLTLPHDDFRPLRRLRFPTPPIDEKTWRREQAQISASGGQRMAPAGVVIMPRAVWDRIGGYDERFVHWGYEDAALLVAAGEFDRLPGPLYHYWHFPRTDKTDPASYALWRAEYWGRAPKQWLVGSGKLE